MDGAKPRRSAGPWAGCVKPRWKPDGKAGKKSHPWGAYLWRSFPLSANRPQLQEWCRGGEGGARRCEGRRLLARGRPLPAVTSPRAARRLPRAPPPAARAAQTGRAPLAGPAGEPGVGPQAKSVLTGEVTRVGTRYPAGKATLRVKWSQRKGLSRDLAPVRTPPGLEVRARSHH